MSHETEIIGICPESLAFQSKYVPLISFKNEKEKKAAENYIIQQAKIFFDDILPDQTVAQLPYPKLITVQDFRNEQISYFYENLFYDLKRKPDGKLDVQIKWGITFDLECVPMRVVWNGEKYKDRLPIRRYGTIDINGKPVFYYIYFTLQEILDVIKSVPTLRT